MPRPKQVPIRKRRVKLHYLNGTTRTVECWRFWDSRDDARLGLQLDANQDGPHHWMWVPERNLECWSVEDVPSEG